MSALFPGLPWGTRRLIVSFDLDGTLDFGDPPGPVGPAAIRTLQAGGTVVGSCSDRTALDQRRLWSMAGLSPMFVVVKSHLKILRSDFPDALLVHVGDRFADQLEAQSAGCLFVHVEEVSREVWRDSARFYEELHRRNTTDRHAQFGRWPETEKKA
ncbi:MAG: HAD family hydrolase [SAR202 cluster bacterium]|nr:HAD family hydrolase [SAR202 cluster bacterium]